MKKDPIIITSHYYDDDVDAKTILWSQREKSFGAQITTLKIDGHGPIEMRIKSSYCAYTNGKVLLTF